VNPYRNLLVKPQHAHESAPLVAQQAGSMSLINDEVGIATWIEFFGNLYHIRERCNVPIHAVNGFDRYIEIIFAVLQTGKVLADFQQLLREIVEVIVCEAKLVFTLGRGHTVMDASVYELVMKNHVVLGREGGEDRHVGLAPGIKDHGTFSSMEVSYSLLEFFRVGMGSVEES